MFSLTHVLDTLGMLATMLLVMAVVMNTVYSFLHAVGFSQKHVGPLIEKASIAYNRMAWGSAIMYEFWMEDIGLVPAYRISGSIFIAGGLFAASMLVAVSMHISVDGGLALFSSLGSGFAFFVVKHGKAFMQVREDIAAQQAAGTWVLA